MDSVALSYWTWETWGAGERLAWGLREHGRVIYADRPRGYSRARATAARAQDPLGENLWRIRPVVLSLRAARIETARRNMGRALAAQLRAAADARGLVDPVLIVHHTPLVEVVDELPWFTVHVVMDWTPAGRDREIELELAERADLVLAIPQSVYHRFKAFHPGKTELLPTSVDVVQLERGLAYAVEPPELRSVARPRLLYGGRVGLNASADLLLEIARRRRDWNVVAVGGADDARLQWEPNLLVVPPQPRERMAEFLAHVDVGLLPYDLRGEQVQHGVSLKFLEYLAAGLPVVGTPLIELERHPELVRLGDTAEELVAAIADALDHPGDEAVRDARREVARAHSVERMAVHFAQLVTSRRSGA